MAHALGTIEEGEEKLASGLESVAELPRLALEDELAKSKAREELEARRGDALPAQVMQLKHEMEEMREASVGGRLGEDGGVYLRRRDGERRGARAPVPPRTAIGPREVSAGVRQGQVRGGRERAGDGVGRVLN